MTLHRVARVEARVVPHRWAWAEAEADRVAENFARRRAERPAIFNGPVLMVAALRVAPDAIAADFFRTDYARLLAHLDLGRPDRSVRNGFAMGALRAADGAFVLGEMAAHTANAGRLYFPAGTPDPGDVRPDGRLDLEGSMRRELAEETGIAVGPEALAPGWTVVEEDGRLGFFRDIVLPTGGEALRERILAHLAAEAEPELAGIRLVRTPAEIDRARTPAYLVAYLEAAFGRAVQR